MAHLKVTMIVRGLDGVEARMRARTQRQKQAVLAVMTRSGDRVLEDVQAHCPVRTQYMRDHTRRVRTREGYHYAVGWFARDFLGKVNPVTKQTIRIFYPVPVIRGTRKRAGNDILTAAELRERPIRRAELREAARA